MAFLVWIALGLIAGFVAGKLSHHTSGALALDITLGVAGAVAGGFAFNSLGFQQTYASVVAGSFGAVIGSVATLAGYRAIFRPV